MVVINKNSANYVTVTVTENTTITSPGYLFEFKNKQTNVYNYCIVGANLSDHDRFDEFLITEQASPNAELAQIELYVGDHTYAIYALTSDQVTDFDINAVDTTQYELTEQGHAKCEGTPLTNTFYTGASSTNTIYER